MIGGILVLYIFIYNKTNIKRNIHTIKQNTSRSRSGYGHISTPVVASCFTAYMYPLILY